MGDENKRSRWERQLEEIAGKILNREKFSYGLNGDALYRQYRDNAVRQGRLAMEDTMGAAQAMTGGYGNSYAQTAGQQAYNTQLQRVNDAVPELQRLARAQYEAEGTAMQDRFGMLQGLEAREYDRYRDSVADENARREFVYNAHRDQVADAKWAAEFQEALRQWWHKNG